MALLVAKGITAVQIAVAAAVFGEGGEEALASERACSLRLGSHEDFGDWRVESLRGVRVRWG